MEPLIIKYHQPYVRTTNNELISCHQYYYDFCHARTIYPFHGIFEIRNGEFLDIVIPKIIYKRINNNDANPKYNLLQYHVNVLY